MLIKVLFEQVVVVEVEEEVTDYADDNDVVGKPRPMTAKELISLRDTNPREYDRIIDDAFDKAVLIVGDDPSEGCTTFLDAED